MALHEREFFNESPESKPAMFHKLRDYLVRVDDLLACQGCGRRFDIPTQQSVVFI